MKKTKGLRGGGVYLLNHSCAKKDAGHNEPRVVRDFKGLGRRCLIKTCKSPEFQKKIEKEGKGGGGPRVRGSLRFKSGPCVPHRHCPLRSRRRRAPDFCVQGFGTPIYCPTPLPEYVSLSLDILPGDLTLFSLRGEGSGGVYILKR